MINIYELKAALQELKTDLIKEITEALENPK
ncbi:phenylpyruvate tautomerase PptA (4-oxalocrotonate tautomerase family) [Pedobacter sp. UYP30]